MVYIVKKFHHYLLVNKFTFFVGHQALLYLVKKPCAMSRIVRLFITLLEFYFEVTFNKGATHQRAHHLSRRISGEAPKELIIIHMTLHCFNLNGHHSGVKIFVSS